ncbi:GNAT family N-acetyltransferase [Clostridium rectalis]|uniref:GNAT family N-acetyltransferase n=1 Tax=Clostridium rectalis TaxID=2040295 RepID=UPI000F62EC63|nr:GNAT family N-acetyltransferase [Clostridium rectalis]
MIIKKADIKQLDNIMILIKDAVEDMMLNGIEQWDHIYPNVEVIKKDIEDGSLYIYVEEDIIKGIIVLNKTQDIEYEDLIWQVKDRFAVIHRLCVNPKYQGAGIAKALIKYVEKRAKDNKFKSIRLDAFIKNTKACSMYEKRGFKKVGTIRLRKGEFYCFEKKL